MGEIPKQGQTPGPRQSGASPNPDPSETREPPPYTTPAPGAPPASHLVLTSGARPLPEYRLVHLLGRGGFGEVWRAVGPGGFDVALKFLRLGEKTGQVEWRA